MREVDPRVSPTTDPTFEQDVRHGLTSTPKQIPPKWLYDDRGTELFEQITQLPDYYLTEAERAIFQRYADEIVATLEAPTVLVELGAGSGEKTRILLDALRERQGHADYYPIDISSKALEMLQQRFEPEPSIRVQPVQGAFVEGLNKLPDDDAPARLIAFIGSSIGNLPFHEQVDLLARIQGTMRPRDRFLLGTDLRKDEATMLAAYDDEQGITARFSLNLLTRINRDLGADFDLSRFAHRPVFNPDKSAVEIYLESLQDQTVHVDAIDLTVTFDEGERMHIEDSHKYTDAMLETLFNEADLTPVQTWTDPDHRFAEHLLAQTNPP